jgi:predicted amidohydrolase
MITPLRLIVEQTAPARGETEANLTGIQAALRRLGTDVPTLVAFPELAVTGYGLGSRTAELALPEADPPPVQTLEGQVALLGFPERAADQRIYNAAGAVSGARWVHRYRKCFLPTYGTFDEGRFFAAASEGPRVFDVHGCSVATLVCEDLWHPSLTYLAALRGADLIVVLAAAPGRSPGSDGDFQSMDRWVHMAEALASFHQVWIAVANRSGVEGGLTFAGGSFVVAPDGTLVDRLGPEAGARLEVALDPDTLRRARARFSHLRDEDGSLLLRELQDTLHADRQDL